jgi:two-component system chemotaxis response regulator CheY
MRFLVVDDSATMRRIMIKVLNGAGHTDCREAANGKEGLDSLAKGGVDVVITDWNMPEMSGLDFVKAIRSNAATSKVPVLMVTTNASQGDIVEAMKAGINGYVSKPFTADTMKEKIDKMLQT